MSQENIIKIEKTYPLFTNHKFHFIVLGVGGNGSELIPKLCRQISFKRDYFGNQIHDISIADGDNVEEKNLLRQNFYKSDLNKNKAETMALKCSTVFNMTVRAYDYYIETPEQLESVIQSSTKVPFIVGCVDTNATRKMIQEYFKNYKKRAPIFWADAGNEEFAGQVVLGHKIQGGTYILEWYYPEPEEGSEDQVVDTHYMFNLPTVCDLYPDIMESNEEFASQLSCAEAAESDPQAADTNIEAANVLYQMISNCMRGKIDYHHVTFNVLKGNRRTIFNDESVLKNYKIKFSKLIDNLTFEESVSDDSNGTEHPVGEEYTETAVDTEHRAVEEHAETAVDAEIRTPQYNIVEQHRALSNRGIQGANPIQWNEVAAAMRIPAELFEETQEPNEDDDTDSTEDTIEEETEIRDTPEYTRAF